MLTGKDLAIAVAEKFKDSVFYIDAKHVQLGGYMEEIKPIEDYLHQKAADILFSEGMAERITRYLIDTENKKHDYNRNVLGKVLNFWRTITPEKILNVWLRLDG